MPARFGQLVGSSSGTGQSLASTYADGLTRLLPLRHQLPEFLLQLLGLLGSFGGLLFLALLTQLTGVSVKLVDSLAEFPDPLHVLTGLLSELLKALGLLAELVGSFRPSGGFQPFGPLA